MSSSPARPPYDAARMLRIAGAVDILLGLGLLIAGFAADLTVLAIVGAVLVASSGTLFVLSRSMARAQAPTPTPRAEDSPFGR